MDKRVHRLLIGVLLLLNILPILSMSNDEDWLSYKWENLSTDDCKLHDIINQGTVEELKEFLQKNTVIKNRITCKHYKRPYFLYNPLERALSRGKVLKDNTGIEMFWILVKAGYNIHAESIFPTLLFLTENYAVTKFLLQKGIDPFVLDKSYRNAFTFRYRTIKNLNYDTVCGAIVLLDAITNKQKTILNSLRSSLKTSYNLNEYLLYAVLHSYYSDILESSRFAMVKHNGYDCYFCYDNGFGKHTKII